MVKGQGHESMSNPGAQESIPAKMGSKIELVGYFYFRHLSVLLQRKMVAGKELAGHSEKLTSKSANWSNSKLSSRDKSTLYKSGRAVKRNKFNLERPTHMNLLNSHQVLQGQKHAKLCIQTISVPQNTPMCLKNL